MIFAAPKPLFGRRTPLDDCPAPITGKAIEHRTAQLAEAAQVLEVLPDEGQTVHALMTGRYDLMQLVAVLIGKLGVCTVVNIATLSFNERNLADMLTLIDSRSVGKMTLLASAFFRDHNKGLWTKTLGAFRERGQRAAAARSHCKIVTMHALDGRKFSMEGSANLRTNSNRENFCLTHDATIHDWHAEWINGLVSKHEGEAHEQD